ncbi:TolC family protein [Caminibacter mediatlanticus]|uniref:TolC family protein n=1 Tax=Caminibacter mediatlanticus TB-2 TaxID=391592 RepID=A0AAI9F321_9BACT|nr:TolC family protein [Caminibacter mediatlanticus]EDM24350.1 hypothetical protein CMTB2_02503 [Caminibacter mediatlanticus TB-2]
MRKLIFLVPFLLQASILSDLKLKELNLDKEKSLKDAIETKRSWINPINLQYSYTKDNIQGIQTTTQLYSISINQPIFKSGAIYYSIKYANVLKKYNLDQIELQKRNLIKQAYDFVYDYKVLKLQKEILIKNIENAKIDVLRKKEAFLNGVGNSSELDNAIIKLNSLKLNLEDINYQLSQIKNSFSTISSLNIEEVTLPKLKLIKQNEYLNNNIELKAQQKLKNIKSYLYKMQRGNQLLTISLNGSLNHKKFENKLLSDTQNYYTIGLSATLPISINAKTKIEKTKIDYLKSVLLIEDKKRQLRSEYNIALSQIKSLKNKINIYKENLSLYNNLIDSTLDSIKAGNATTLDLKVLNNSKMVDLINIKILKLKIQKTLFSLYYKLISYTNN